MRLYLMALLAGGRLG